MNIGQGTSNVEVKGRGYAERDVGCFARFLRLLRSVEMTRGANGPFGFARREIACFDRFLRSLRSVEMTRGADVRRIGLYDLF